MANLSQSLQLPMHEVMGEGRAYSPLDVIIELKTVSSLSCISCFDISEHLHRSVQMKKELLTTVRDLVGQLVDVHKFQFHLQMSQNQLFADSLNMLGASQPSVRPQAERLSNDIQTVFGTMRCAVSGLSDWAADFDNVSQDIERDRMRDRRFVPSDGAHVVQCKRTRTTLPYHSNVIVQCYRSIVPTW
jgi:hypothetical protein